MIETGLKYELDHVKQWNVDHPEEHEVFHGPCQAFSRYEPLGVVAVIGSWNVPLVTCFKPLM